ncbi:MAG: hypothetical protein JWR50_352 [Mucilaginibacter sp.]|nr:hypothetical protein [Mucilaginibacter sp.]
MDMEEPLKKAFDGALDLIKQLITLSTGTLALTATFIKDILKLPDGHAIPHKAVLFITWGLMLLSIFCGLLAHGALTGTLEGADIVNPQTGTTPKRISPYDSNIRIWALAQCIVFYLGIVMLIVYVGCCL